MRQSGYLLASLEGSTAGYLERRAFGELNFDALESEGDPLSALWLLEARDLNHVIALFDEHPVLSSFGVMIRALKRDGK